MDLLFFDLDGTLTDPRIGITRSIQYALEKLGRDVPPEDDLVWCIGPPRLASFEKILGAGQSAATALSFHRQRYADKGLYENCLYPGIEDTLAVLGAGRHRLFIATSKPTK